MYDFLALSNCVPCDGVFVAFFLKLCTIKELLDSVFVISGISAAAFGSADNTCSILIISDITKTSSNTVTVNYVFFENASLVTSVFRFSKEDPVL